MSPHYSESEHPHEEIPSSVRQALGTIATEVHSCTHAVGRLTAEVASQGDRIGSLEAAFRGMRTRLKSMPAEMEAQAEDTANHRIELLEKKLEAERVAARLSDANALAVKAKAEAEELRRMERERRLLWERRGWGLVRAILVGVASMLLEHYAHLIPR